MTINGRAERGCLTDGELRALLDGESESGRAHLEGCARCAARLDDLRVSSASVNLALTRIAGDCPDVNPQVAYARLKHRLSEQQWTQDVPGESTGAVGGNWMADLMGRRVVRTAGALAAIFLMMFAFAFTPMRGVAEDFLGQFRVKKFVAVTIPMDMLEPLKSGMFDNMSEMDKAMLMYEASQLGTFETTFNFDMESPPAPVTPEEAEAAYGSYRMPDSLPDGYGPAELYVTEAGAASYTMNVERMRAIIRNLGLPIYAFDQVEAETLTFGANIPAAVVQKYETADGDKLVVGQMESPTLVIPDGFSMDQLREDILRFPGLPTDLVAQLRAVEDWEQTLIIPIPEGATSRDVTVDGKAALLIEHLQGAAVLWEDGGILYAVAGQASSDEIMRTANSMYD